LSRDFVWHVGDQVGAGAKLGSGGTRFRSEPFASLVTEPRGCHSRRRRRLGGGFWHVVLGRDVAGPNCVSISTLPQAARSFDLATMQRARKLIGMSQDALSSFQPRPDRSSSSSWRSFKA
jgi:hypothetical protein